MTSKYLSENIPYFYDGEKKKRKNDWSLSFLGLSMGFFLCITTSLIMITTISDFALTYHNRDLLIQMLDHIYNESSTEAIPILTTKLTSVSDAVTTVETDPPITVTTSLQSSESEYTSADPSTISSSNISSPSTDILTSKPEPVSSSEPPKETTQAPVPTTSESNGSSTSTESLRKKDPVQLLNEENPKISYECIELCKDPSIITARINVSLSSNTDSFLYSAVSYFTDDMKAAKKSVAHFALQTLYKARIEECDFNPQLVEVAPYHHACNHLGNTTWEKCKNKKI